MKKTLFITFEGIDRCGKSTQVRYLSERLHREGRAVLTLRDPGGTHVSEQIRNILLSVHNSIDPVTELLLYEAARAQIVAEKIRPALDQGTIVIMDRFYDSTTAYQGFGRQLDHTIIDKANHIATGGLVPDVTFFIDISWEEAERRRQDTAKDRMEQEAHAFFDRIRAGYEAISRAESKRMLKIDGARTQEHIAEEIYGHASAFLLTERA